MSRKILFLSILVVLLIITNMIYIYYIYGGFRGVMYTPYKVFRISGNDLFLVVLVDNYRYDPGLESEWGVSIYVEAYGVKMLFDTGPDPDVLRNNALKIGVNLSDLDLLVLSHEHMDHVGGLKYVGEARPGLKVYIPKGSGLTSYVRSLGLKPMVVNHTVEIIDNIYIIGPLYGPPYEEALAINTRYGLVLLVGCSHPGVDKFVEEAVKYTGAKPYIVIGGFHLIGRSRSCVEKLADKLVGMGIDKIMPIHCSGDYIRSYLKTHYPDKYVEAGVGYELLVRDIGLSRNK